MVPSLVADIVGRVGCTLKWPAQGIPFRANLRRPHGAGKWRGASQDQ
jgi:hypothetical protein